MTAFEERWRVPLLWWLVLLAVSVVAAAEIHGGADGLRAVVPYAVLPVLTLAGLGYLSRAGVAVRDGQLVVPGARAPLSAFGEPEVLDRDQLRQWRGPRAKRDAWVQVRPWHKGAVLLPVTDADDPTPYWLIGSRDPGRLAVVCSS